MTGSAPPDDPPGGPGPAPDQPPGESAEAEQPAAPAEAAQPAAPPPPAEGPAAPARPVEPGASGSVDISLDTSGPIEIPPGGSGSVDVPVEPSGPVEVSPGESGSVDVRLSDLELPAASSAPRKSRIVPAIVGGISEKVTQAADALGDKVVQAADALGDKVVQAGDRVGESLAHLPVVPRTRRGRVMARSVVVSFVLVFAWIAVIVGLQLRHPRPPDFRPLAEAILIAIRDGQVEQVYQASSIHFQEVVLSDTFEEQMRDMNDTLGPFQEISAVLDTVTNRGPGGKTGRVDVRIEFARTSTKGSLSFRWEDGRWALLGLSIEVPEEIVKTRAGTDEARRARVACPDEATVLGAGARILERAGGPEAERTWREAAPAFRQSITLESFVQTEQERGQLLGAYHRVLGLNCRQNPRRTGTSLSGLVVFDAGQVRASLEFTKIDGVWKLTFYKVVVPH